MFIPEGVDEEPITQRPAAFPSEDDLHVFSLSRHIATAYMRPYMSHMVYALRPYFVEGHGISVDRRARLYVGVESLRQFDATKEMGYRLGQKLLDAGYVLLMELHDRADLLPEPEKGALAAELETTRDHPETVTKRENRHIDDVFLYPEHLVDQLGEELVEGLRSKGMALEELYTHLKSLAPEAYSMMLELGEDGDEGDGAAEGEDSGDEDERPGRTSRQLNAMRESTAQEMLAQAAGTVPMDLLRWAESRKAPVVVPWHVALNRVFSRAAATRPGSCFETYEDRADEQVAVDMYYARLRGTSIASSMGVPRVPATRGFKSMFDIYVDTSGSMTEGDLGTVLGQVEPAFRRHQARIRVWAGDTEVHNLGAAGSLRAMSTMLKGGGGTSFVPAFNKWASMPSKDRPKSVMFFTDGYGPAPAKPPPGMKVYWILIGQMQRVPWIEGGNGDVSYGTIVRVPTLD